LEQAHYSEKHVGIRDAEKKVEKWFPLFLSAAALFKKNINFNENQYLLSFAHAPNDDNFWHCELFIKDQETGEKIPRDIKYKKARYRLLAEHVLGQYVTKAICPKSEVIPFRRVDFDKMLK
jgi:hypothetical protein